MRQKKLAAAEAKSAAAKAKLKAESDIAMEAVEKTPDDPPPRSTAPNPAGSPIHPSLPAKPGSPTSAERPLTPTVPAPAGPPPPAATPAPPAASTDDQIIKLEEVRRVAYVFGTLC